MTAAGLQSVGARIKECSSCQTPLPLAEALLPEDTRVWLCSQCGAEHSATLATNYTIDELRGVRPEPLVIDQSAIQPASQEILAFAQRFGAREGRNVEKRSSHRHPVIAVLAAQEFDSALRPIGDPFQIVCRNLSAGGICLINDRTIQSDLLVLEMSAAGGVPIQTLANIRRRRPIGPYHDIGAEFVTKLASSNSKMLR